jgi:acyl dehydratase
VDDSQNITEERKNMSTMYYEDFEIGMEFESPGRTITETDVVMFSGLSGDFNVLHTDEEFGKKTRFGQRIAHGMLGISVVTGLMSRTGIFEGSAIALLGINNWRFMGPIFIGDTVHVRYQVMEKRLSKTNSKQGILNRYYELVNQRGEIVQKGEMPVMVKTKLTTED